MLVSGSEYGPTSIYASMVINPNQSVCGQIVGTVWARGIDAVDAHTDTVPATFREDMIAIDVYRYAQQTGQPLTLGLVERRIDELLSHPPDCACGCAAAVNVRPVGVWYVVRGWAGGIAATRRRAAK
jgi:hypothetical protein